MKKVVCKICETIFYTRYINRKVIYCSRKCLYKDPSRMPRGEEHYKWKGGKHFCNGRPVVLACDPLSGKKKYQYEYRIIAEKALGMVLPAKAEVHHIDKNPTNNNNPNLVICQDNAYHTLLHYRARILKAGGNPSTDKICSKCQQVKSKKEFSPGSAMYYHGDGYYAYCKPCKSNYKKSYRLQPIGVVPCA